MAQEFDLLIKISAATDGVASAFNKMADGLDKLEKKLKKFGREFTQNVTAPVAALAALSLKKVFDDAVIGKGTEATNAFAASVQGLKKDFDSLLITIGERLAPIATKVSNFFSNMIRAFNSLSPAMQDIVVKIGLFAAAIGPVALGLASVVGIASKLLPIFAGLSTAIGAIVSVLSSPITLIVGLGAAVAGLVNVFLKLKEAGVSTGNAIIMTFNLVVGFVQKFVLGTIAKVVGKVYSLTGKLAGLVSADLKKSYDEAAAFADGVANNLSTPFDNAKAEIDAKLSSIGSSAGKAFTFGLSESVPNMISSFMSGLDQVTSSTGNKLVTFSEEIAAKAKEINTQIASSATDGLLALAEGTKTAEQAFADMARSIIKNIAQMIIQQTIFNAISGASGTGGIGGFFGRAAAKGFASGGFVTGPGTSTSDSIPAMLSNGEFVTDAKTVATFGTDFFHNLKRMSRNGAVTRGVRSGNNFAEGGLVTGSSQAPQVVIQNSGSPKNVAETSFDPQTAVTTVILEDFNKNGPISKSMQRSFSVRKAGFT
jgi:hypothetical protein